MKHLLEEADNSGNRVTIPQANASSYLSDSANSHKIATLPHHYANSLSVLSDTANKRVFESSG